MDATLPRGNAGARLALGAIACIALTAIAALVIDAGTGPGGNPGPEATHSQVSRAYGQLPLSFQPNRGQSDRRVRFLSQGAGYGLLLTRHRAVFALRRSERANGGGSAVLSMGLLGARPDPQISGAHQLPGRVNYMVGRERSRWHTGIPTFEAVRYSEVWPGIGMRFYGNQRRLEYDFDLAPGARVSAIQLRFEGQRSLRIGTTGDLLLDLGQRTVRQLRPVAFQVVEGRRHQVASHYVLLAGDRVGVRVGVYDHRRPLVIDPQLVYSSYLGGTGADGDSAAGIAVDAAGNAYVVGTTSSIDFPTTPGALQPVKKGQSYTPNAYVTKLNPSGSGLVYSTYLGGSEGAGGAGIAVNASGEAFVTGSTGSTDFPTTPGTVQPTNGGSAAGFVSKLNASGSGLSYSTYLGGSEYDASTGIAIDGSGSAYVAGYTRSSDFPVTPGAFRQTPGPSGIDAPGFVTKLNPTGGALAYSTYMPTRVKAIAADSGGNALVTGTTQSTDYPTTPGAFQTANPASRTSPTLNQAPFVTKLNPSGSGLVYSTYLGGSGIFEDWKGSPYPVGDEASAIAVDSAGDAYVTGAAFSRDFPITPGAFRTTNPNPSSSAYVTKLNPSGSNLVYSTYLGGSCPCGGGGSGVVRGDEGTAIAVDPAGQAYVAGLTLSDDFPTTPGAFQPFIPAPRVPGGLGDEAHDAFLTKLNLSGAGLLYSTYLGGSGWDAATGVAVDPSSVVYLTGNTGIVYSGYPFSGDFPTTPGAFQTSRSGDQRPFASIAFVSKLDPASTTAGQPVVTARPATDVGTSGATLNGTVDPNGASTTYYVEYGTGTTYGSATSPQDAGAGTSSLPTAVTLSALSPSTTYHYRFVGSNVHGTTLGPDQRFGTLARTTIVAGPRGRTHDRTPTFRFISTSSGEGSFFVCVVGKGGFNRCRSPHRLKRLSLGRHTFWVSTFENGSLGPFARRTFRVIR